MKNLLILQELCRDLGISVNYQGRQSKEPYIEALRNYFWQSENPGRELPPQLLPMLLADWAGLDEQTAMQIESDHSDWIVQPKLDGVRVLMHIQEDGVRITGRNFSETNFRLTEHQACVSHLQEESGKLAGTILDGELVCPIDNVNTGETITTSKLQAAVAVLAATPVKAKLIQESNRAHLEFHCFDILRLSGISVTDRPLIERLDFKQHAVTCFSSDHVKVVPSYFVNKRLVHDRILAEGGEGTVWKRLDQPYETGKRVKHWIKRKRSFEVQAYVSNFKLGKSGHANERLVGAVEFSIAEGGSTRPIAWVCNLTNEERRRMTSITTSGTPSLDASYLGREAIVCGQDVAGRSGRIRHAQIRCWR